MAPRRHGTTLERLVLALAVVALLPACYDQALEPAYEDDGRVQVINDETELGERVEYPDEDVPIEAPDASGMPASTGPVGAPARAPSSIDLTLLGEIEAPRIFDFLLSQLVELQATSVWITRHDDRAIVSYNIRGATQIGAMDYYTRLLNRRPKLSSAVYFLDADVNSVFADSENAYAATASRDDDFPDPAVLERIPIRGDKFRLLSTLSVLFDTNERAPLSSFAATSTTSTGETIYATSGDDGGLFAFDPEDLSAIDDYPLDDARWVAWDEDNDRIVVVQGTPGRITVFDADAFPLAPVATYTFPGADVPESKSTVEVLGGKAFIAAGPAGVQVMCLDNGAIVGNVPIPDPDALGLDSTVVVTNSVTVDEDLMFISNGEAGVYAAAGAQSFATSSCTAQQSITVLGRLGIGRLQSANHVAYRDGSLYVAAGLGGTKVVDVDLD